MAAGAIYAAEEACQNGKYANGIFSIQVAQTKDIKLFGIGAGSEAVF